MKYPTGILSPEEKLVFSLCRLEFDDILKNDIRELMSESRDWGRFIQLVTDHGITALAARNIHHLELNGQMPAEIMKLLDGGRMQNMIRNTWLAGRWKEVNTILSQAGIRHVLLKGMALEHTVYRSAGLRQMNDVDILVKKDEIVKAWLLLKAHGFISDMIKSPLYRRIITETGKHMPTLRKDGFPVELHHRLFMSPERNKLLDSAIDNAVEIKLEGSPAYIPGNDIHLEFLKSHFEDHRSAGGIQLRLWLDMELLSPGSAPEFTAEMLKNPNRPPCLLQRKEYFRKYYYSMPRSVRPRFLAGDIFPSLKWMKKRHNCSSVKALMLYPRRLGKLLWLV
jgi:hypothetical protein